MTPTQIENSARNKYNAIGDTFFGSAEILDLMWQACIDLTRDTNLIENTYTTPTVASQQAYSYPTTAIAIKRISYEGNKLKKVTFKEDDIITGFNQSTTDSGTPTYYYIWNKQVFLRPIPSAVGTLKIYTYNEPQVITSTSALEIPTHFHMDLIYYICAGMALKDSNERVYQLFDKKWIEIKENAKKWARINKRADSFSVVQEDLSYRGYVGEI